MPSTKPQLKTYVDENTFEKFKYIAEKEGRSTSNYLKRLAIKEIENYEAQNGKIEVGGVQRSRRVILENCILKWIPGYAIMAVG